MPIKANSLMSLNARELHAELDTARASLCGLLYHARAGSPEMRRLVAVLREYRRRGVRVPD